MDFGSGWGLNVCHLTTQISVLCALSSRRHPPRTLPSSHCPKQHPWGKGIWLFPSKDSRVKMDLLSPSPIP